MPVICETSLAAKLGENLAQSFKKSEKENNHPSPTVKQVLSAKIDYEEVSNYKNATLDTLQTKYIVLKTNQKPLEPPANGKYFTNIKLT